MQIQVPGPTGVNSKLSERDASAGVRVCICVCACMEKGVCAFKTLSVPFVSTTMAPQAYDRDTLDERPEGPRGPCYT